MSAVHSPRYAALPCRVARQASMAFRLLRRPVNRVERTGHTAADVAQDVRVDHGRGQLPMADQFLNGTDIVAALRRSNQKPTDFGRSQSSFVDRDRRFVDWNRRFIESGSSIRELRSIHQKR